MKKNVVDLANRIFGRISYKYCFVFDSIREDLKKAGLELTLEEYFSLFLFFGFVTSFLVLVVSFLIFSKIFKNLVISGIISLYSSIFSFLAILSIFYFYPSISSIGREKTLDNEVYIGCLFMSAIASSGLPPHVIFQKMSLFSGIKELSKVMKEIVKYMEYYGYDLSKSIVEACRYVPSRRVRDLLYGIRAAILSGGSLHEYLYEKSRLELMDQKRRLEEFGTFLSLITEIFITLISLGITLGVILCLLLLFITPNPYLVKIIYFLIATIPIFTMIFVIYIKILAP